MRKSAILGLAFISLMIAVELAWGQGAGDYRSKATGNWNAISTWERYDGSQWVDASATPTSSDGVITIRNGHTVTVTVDVTVDQVVVQNGGRININGARTLTIANGSGTDLTIDGGGTVQVGGGSGTAVLTINSGASVNVSGTLTNGYQGALGSITVNGTLTFQDGAVYTHEQNAGTVPTATWNTGSTCKILGPTGNTTAISGLNQAFYNFTWDISNQTGDKNANGNLTTINGDFTVNASGDSSALVLASTQSPTLNVGGNFVQTGGILTLTSSTGNVVMNVSGNFSMSGGTLRMSGSSGTGTINVSGNFSHTGGTITETSTGSGSIVFNKSGTQTYTSGGTVSGTINFTVNSGSTLSMGTSTITGGGSFTLSSGAGIEIGSTAGITSSGASGNIQVSGTRSYSTGANYIYNGSSAQVTGSGLPSTVNNLTINNSSGVTLTNGITVSSSLTLTSGNLTTTDSYTLTVGSSGSISRTSGHVIGNLKKTAVPSSFTFHVGTANGYSPVALSNVSGTGDFTVKAVQGKHSSLPESQAHYLNRYWTLTNAGLSSADLQFNYIDGDVVGTESHYRIYRLDASTGWVLVDGTINTGANTATVTGASSFSDWTLLGGGTLGEPTAVKLISFTAKSFNDNVLLQWKTGYEFNNLGFHVYCEEEGELYRLTPELITGSAFIAGSGVTIRSGRSYQWWDTSVSIDPRSSILDPRTEVKYWLEDIDLNGKRTMHGPAIPVVSNEPLPEKVNAELLSEFRMRVERRYEHFWRIQELKQKLSHKQISDPRSAFSPQRLSLITQSSSLSTFVSAALAQATQQERNTQWLLASKPAVKILVNETGWYRISQPDLIKAGLNSKINPKYLQLFVDGKEQPIRVIGEGDRKFDPQDAIEFYGTGLDTPFTDTRVYWLVVGSTLGKRLQPFTGQGTLGAPLSFPFTVEKKPRTFYFAGLKNGDADNFFGPFIWQTPLDEVITIRHLDSASKGNAGLEVALQGGTNLLHKVRIRVNHTEVGQVEFLNQSRKVVTIPISQSLLREGDNLITLESLGGEMDVSLLDYIRLTYWHTYKARDNSLGFTAPGGNRISISNFTTSNIRVVDITSPANFYEVTGKVKAEAGGFSITFGVPGSGNRSLLAFTEGRIKRPGGVVANQPSSWHQSGLAYDFVMIAHRDFLPSLGPLKTLRGSQGLSVALMDVEDIYDEFNFGAKSPQAIKDLLMLAKSQWAKPPRFVLLVGDASFDPRNYLGLGNFDFVPTKLIDTYYNETASDDWFVDFDGNGIPEMAIGRLPVRTGDDIATVISKIVDYESLGGVREALLVADQNDGFNFEAASVEIEALLLQAGVGVKEIFRGVLGSGTEQVLISELHRGPMLVNYIGHGSEAMWRGNLLTTDKAEALTNGLNGKRLPFFVNMTCLNGYFHDIYMEGLAEALLTAKQGGAVAVWTSSGLTDPGGQVAMNKELIRLLFNGESLRIGEAVMGAKAAVSNQDIRRTWILFGDPTTRLK